MFFQGLQGYSSDTCLLGAYEGLKQDVVDAIYKNELRLLGAYEGLKLAMAKVVMPALSGLLGAYEGLKQGGLSDTRITLYVFVGCL